MTARRIAIIAPLLAGGLFVSGCMSSPTYGTDKTANEQLFTDVSNIASLAPQRKAAIDYKPRPDLVRPASTKDLSLPPPQDSVASVDNPDWVESPEQRRARLSEEIVENRDKPGFRSPVVDDEAIENRTFNTNRTARGNADDGGHVDPLNRVAAREEVRKRIQENRQGSATTRKYLSEPPLTYRQAAESAPQDDIGEDESVKERAAKRAARKDGGSWRDWVPGL